MGEHSESIKHDERLEKNVVNSNISNDDHMTDTVQVSSKDAAYTVRQCEASDQPRETQHLVCGSSDKNITKQKKKQNNSKSELQKLQSEYEESKGEVLVLEK